MNNKIYDEYETIVKFHNLNNCIYFDYNNNLNIVDLDTINKLKNELPYPYKVSFIGLSIIDIGKILDILLEDDVKLHFYHILENNEHIYNAVFIKNEKIKKL